MDELLNVSNAADANSPVLNGENNATPVGHEPSSLPHQDTTSQRTFFWPQGTINSPCQELNPSQATAESAQIAPESLTPKTMPSVIGIDSQALSDSNDNTFHKDQQSLRTATISPLRFRYNNGLAWKTNPKDRWILEKHLDLDVNELVDGQGILHVACRLDLWELLDVILEMSEVNVNLKTHEGLAGLHIACEKDNVAVVNRLLQSPQIDVNICDSTKSKTPLHLAAMQGNQKLMKRLLDMANIDVQANDADGYLPVHYAAVNPMQATQSWVSDAAEDESNDVLLRICAQGAVNSQNPQGRGPLHLAAQAGHITALKVLLAHPDLVINMRDTHGDTALHLAQSNEISGMLLGKGLDANFQNIDGNTALHCALQRRSTELIHILMEHTILDSDITNKKGEHYIHIAAAEWDLETFKRFASTPPHRNLNMPDGNGETPLHIASHSDNIDIVEYLLSIPSVAVHAKDKLGRTALHLACEKGRIGIVKRLLIDPSLYVNSPDRKGQTPLHLACGEGHLEVVWALLANTQVDVEAGNADGLTPLHIASKSAFGEQIVCELLRAGIDVNGQVPVTGATALHFASLGGHFKTVLSLLEHGADPRITCLVGPDSSISKDAAGVADKIEIVDLIRHYRWRKIPLVPDPLTYSQEGLLKRHASSVYVMWEWPRAENPPHAHSKGLNHKRQRLFPDISPVYNIYARPAYGSEKTYRYEREQQLRYQKQGKPFAPGKKKNGRRLMENFERHPTKWVHFSAQNRRWVEDFCRLMYSHGSLHTEGIDVLTFIDDTFDQNSVAVGYHGDVYREHCVRVSTLPVTTDKVETSHIKETIEESPTRITSLDFHDEGAVTKGRQYSVAAIVVPLVDIDMMKPGFIADRTSFALGNDGRLGRGTTNVYEDPELTPMEQAHVDMIMSLHSEFKVQRSRSLDHYFHRDLTDADLQIVNAEQVLSRYIHHQQTRRDPYLKKANFSHKIDVSTSSRILSALRNFLDLLAELGMMRTSVKATQVEDGFGQSYIKPHLARQYILIVPQLWLWKFDNVLITAFPARWDSSNLHSASEYVRSRVEMQETDVSSEKLLHEIVAACLDYQPTFSLFGRQLTYQDAFSGEISRISRDIDQCYKSFRNDLGKSDDRFLDAFKTATTSLLDIDDALNELKMIKRVYQNQAQVWEDLHKDRTLAMDCGCTQDQAPRRLYTMMTRLEEDAHSVRESVVTLLQLTQGSASTENALKASEQSKILAIFTVVTVIFTPLSWIASLFALKIDSFHAEEMWTARQVAGGSIICLGGTLVLCAVGWKWLNRKQPTREQTREKPPAHHTYRS